MRFSIDFQFGFFVVCFSRCLNQIPDCSLLFPHQQKQFIDISYRCSRYRRVVVFVVVDFNATAEHFHFPFSSLRKRTANHTELCRTDYAKRNEWNEIEWQFSGREFALSLYVFRLENRFERVEVHIALKHRTNSRTNEAIPVKENPHIVVNWLDFTQRWIQFSFNHQSNWMWKK